MPGIGPMEIVVVLVIALLVLGPKRLPEMGRSLGTGMRSFKDAVSGDSEPQEELPSTHGTGQEGAGHARDTRSTVA